MPADRLLQRAIERSADAAGVGIVVTRCTLTRWASATFAGARHELAATLTGGSVAERWLAALPEAELPVRGHLVADLKIVAATRADDRIEVVLEALTVEDR